MKVDLEKSFINQSAYFLNLYQYMKEMKETAYISKNDYQVKDWDILMSSLSNCFSIKNRKVFHINPKCVSLKSDYIEEVYLKNTGVFAEDKPSNKHLSYPLVSDYLIHLGMRACKVCSGEL